MPQGPNKLAQFWQELKRRNVVRVVTVYAGAAFVIIELINNITEPLHLPEWTPTLVIVLLAIGFPVAIIFSWIYDVHPEGSMVKTEPAEKVKSEEIPKSSNSWKIASYISFVVIVALIVLNVIPRTGKKEILEKSIAVLPFNNESSDQENTYFINGMMESILDNLSRIEDLKVRGRTSVEQYRNNPKPIPTVAEEMNVSYVMEGSGQKIGNRILLSVQLIIGKDDDHIWSRQYDKRIEKVEDLIDLQKEIALSIVEEIEAVITPEEKQLIEKVPTTSLMANELYQMGRDEYIKFLLNVSDRNGLTRAQEYYLKALDYDSTYAKACAGVALTFYNGLVARGKLDMIYSKGYLDDNAFDTVFFWANKALYIDNQLPEAFYIRGNYYWETGQREKAEEDFRKAIQLNPNYWEALFGLGNMYTWIDFSKTIEYYQIASKLVRGPEYSYLLMAMIQTYMLTGNFEQSESLITDYVSLTQDSLFHYIVNYGISLSENNINNVLYWLTRAYDYDSTDPDVLNYLARSYIDMGNIEKGLEYYKQSDDIYLKLDRISYNNLHRIGYACSLAGNKEEADQYFDRAEKILKRLIELNRPSAQWGNSQYDLALVYAYRSEKSKAMEILRNLHHSSPTPLVAASWMQQDPMLDGIRDDPEFQQIANDLGIKYQAEIERFNQWLEENEML